MSALKSLERADPTPFSYQGEVYARGLKYEKPSLTFDSTKWEGLAKERMSGDAWGYVYGSAGTRQTDENNIESLRKWALMPRRLRYQSMPDLSVELLGEKYPYPIAISPIGVQHIVHSDGEIATASAAAAERVPYICSTAASASIEDIAQANGSGHRWYQLYWPANEYNDLTASVLKRAQDAGYTVLVVTTDTYISGWRPSDMDNGYSPFLKGDQIGVAIGFTDPVYRTFFKDKYGKEVEDDMATAAATWSKIFFNGYPHNWEDLKFLRQHWKGPIAIKGIQSVEDAKKCVELGMDAVYVSTHGGRQCDAQIGALETLPEIAAAVGGKIEIIFDSGVRSGADVIKALALGANMVCIGRPWLYGLAIGGENGVRHVLKAILGEIDVTLHQLGIPSVKHKDLNAKLLRRVRDTRL